MPVLGWVLCAMIAAIGIPGSIGAIAAVLVMFVFALPASAVFWPLLMGVSAIGLKPGTAQSISFGLSVALAVVVAGVLATILSRYQLRQTTQQTLTNLLVFIIATPIGIAAA